MLKLHFAPNSRAGRIVWLLEELKLPYAINKMAFHPSALKSHEHRARHGDGGLKPPVDARLYPKYLQWFHYCEGMVMPPVNTIVVQTILLPKERRNEEVLGQAQRLVGRALAPVEEALTRREYLIDAFSAADIMLGHAIFMCNRLGLVSEQMTNLRSYVARMEARPAFQTAINMQPD
jgi:glutathione S-transferase